MTLFTQLSERQQEAMLGQPADRGTRKALSGMGLAEFADVSGAQTVMLTPLGLLVLFHHGQRTNTASLFAPGDRVIVMDFTWHNGELRFNGLEGVILARSKRVVVQLPDGTVWQREPGNIAHYDELEDRGLIGLVRQPARE